MFLMTPLDSIKTEIAGYITQCDDNLANLDVQSHLHLPLLFCGILSCAHNLTLSFAIISPHTQKKGAYLAKQLQDYEASFKEMAK